MDTPLHSRDKGTVKTVGFLRQTGCEEGEDGEISRQDDGCGFLNARGIIYTDYLEKGQTITGAYYESLLHRLSEKIKKKRPHLKKKKILSYQDNVLVHTCAISMAKIMELKFELLQHPPYLPDLAPSDFFISKLEKMARRTPVHVERESHRPNRCLF